MYSATKSDDEYRVQVDENRATHCPDTASQNTFGFASVAYGSMEYEDGLGLYDEATAAFGHDVIGNPAHDASLPRLDARRCSSALSPRGGGVPEGVLAAEEEMDGVMLTVDTLDMVLAPVPDTEPAGVLVDDSVLDGVLVGVDKDVRVPLTDDAAVVDAAAPLVTDCVIVRV